MPIDNDHLFKKYFTAIADLLGLHGKDFMEAVDATRAVWGKAKSAKIRELENRTRREGVHRRLIGDFYSSSNEDSQLRQCTILLSNQRYSSTIFTAPNRMQLSLPLSSIETNYISIVPEPPDTQRFAKLMKRQAAKVANKFDLLGVRFWDQDIYRLIADPFMGESPKLSFSLSRFLNYRFTAGLLEDELFDALIDHENDIQVILDKRSSALAIRNELLPSTNSLTHLSERISAGGLACVVAMARGVPYNDYVIPLQVRSHSVAEGRGVITASLQAWHQPNIGDYHNEVSLYWTVLRELFEEMFGGYEVIEETPHLRYDWYLKECPGVAYVHHHPDQVSIEFLGIGINALVGTYDCAVLLAIHDDKYWDKYSRSILRNWEAKRWILLSTKNVVPTLENVFKNGWLDQGMFGLTQGLVRLRDLDRNRVSDLDIGFDLG
jgi:hypothetical protein